MGVTPRNLVNHELIGLTAHVVASRDPTLVCCEGIIVNESKEMLHLATDKRVLRIPKRISVFDLSLQDGTVVRVEGDNIRGRPEERLKRQLRRRW